MIAVQWNYPQNRDETTSAVPVAPPQPPATRPTADVASLNFNYAVEVVEGKPAWKPKAVYDDGAKTYIRFDSSMLHGESPALFVIERGEMQIVNYRVKGNLYIVDRLFRLAELRLGQDHQDIVRLRNRASGAGSAPARSPAPTSPRQPGSARWSP
jgi:type IV secretion system protein VirB9